MKNVLIRKWLCLAFLIGSYTVQGQRKEQVWLDFQVDYPFANQYLFEVIGSYQTVLTNENKWRNFNVTPTFEYLRFRRLDLIFNLPMTYTLQTDTVNSVEFNPTIGFRYNITQNRRIDTRFLMKYEHRIFRQIEADEWDASNRVRLKAEAWISINGPNLFTDKLWYAIVDYEEFIVVDQQLKERFANRRRGRIGLGYRLDYKNRFEVIYSLQSSKDEINDSFSGDASVIQFRYKMFLNPPRAASTTP